MMTERDRVISVCLTETEWRALVARHPQPVHWLREQILIEVALAANPEAQGPRSDASAELA
jgi:hypothetical protein